MAAGLGFKTFATGDVLSAADTNGYLMQGVLVFASAAARDSSITSPQEGQFAYLKDTNVTTYYTGSAWANLDTTGMTNPMTTTGDTIYSSSGSTPARLGIGSSGQVLTVAAGIPSWATPSATASGLTKVASATFSGVSSTTTTFDGVFTSTYNNYQIVMSNIVGTVSSAVFQFQWRKSAVTKATDYFGARLTNGTLATYANTTSVALFLLESEAGHIVMNAATDATPTQMSYQGFQRISTSMVSGANANDTTGANTATGFILSASSGNISGTVAVYGWAD